jgi:cytochrome c peroxidase
MIVGLSSWTALVGGCTDETLFTDEELEVLGGYRLPSAAPPNPSNRVADSRDAAILGKKLFFDARLSGTLGPANTGVSDGSLGPAGSTGKVACAACHALELGGADRRSRTPTSLGANYGLRNSPTVINTVFSDVARGGWQLWDGRRDSVWSVAMGPMEGANEHAGTRLQYAHLIYQLYRADYERIFGPLPDLADTARFPLAGRPGQPAFDGMAPEDKIAINRVFSNLGKATEAYQRLLISQSFSPSAFDRMLAGEESAMTPGAVRGAKLFIGKAACNDCHTGPMFTDHKFHNIGCPQEGPNVPTIDLGRPMGIMITKNDTFNRASMYSDQRDDSHLVDLAPTEADVGAFRTPTLRNVAKTFPYMHNGVYTNLWDVVEHYNFGGGTGSYSGKKVAALVPLLLSDRELDDIVEFLRSLDDGDPLPIDGFPEGLTKAPPLP